MIFTFFPLCALILQNVAFDAASLLGGIEVACIFAGRLKSGSLGALGKFQANLAVTYIKSCVYGFSVMMKLSLLAIIVAAGPALAQEEISLVDPLPELINRNSSNCEFTFFSDGDDVLDLRGETGQPCFDLKGGRDILALDEKNFPKGVTVFTGPGQDIVLTGNGDDIVTTFDDEDEEFILRGGDDILIVEGVLAEGFSAPGEAPRTRIKMGSGHDKVTFGFADFDNSIRLRSPNLEVWGEHQGLLEIDGYCGRYFDGRAIDFTMPLTDPEKSVIVNTKGCGLSFVRQAGDLQLEQIGGRLNLSMRPQENTLENAPARIVGNVKEGAAFSGSFEISSRDSEFVWEGFGLAALNVNFLDNYMGGVFDIKTSKAFFGTLDLSYGNASISATALESAEVVLQGALSGNRINIDLIAPTINLTWFPSFGRFPEITTSRSGVVADLVGRQDAIEDDVLKGISISDNRVAVRLEAKHNALLAKEPVSGEQEESSAEDKPSRIKEKAPRYDDLKESEKTEVYYSVSATTSIVEDVNVVAGKVKMSIHSSSGGEGCIEMRISDEDKKMEDLYVPCDGQVFVADVSSYEQITLKRDGNEMVVEINGDTQFRVDTLTVRN